jgi:hypothetical protein
VLLQCAGFGVLAAVALDVGWRLVHRHGRLLDRIAGLLPPR